MHTAMAVSLSCTLLAFLRGSDARQIGDNCQFPIIADWVSADNVPSVRACNIATRLCQFSYMQAYGPDCSVSPISTVAQMLYAILPVLVPKAACLSALYKTHSIRAPLRSREQVNKHATLLFKVPLQHQTHNLKLSSTPEIGLFVLYSHRAACAAAC